MIIVCPTCSSKYSVQDKAIDGEKMVRCPLCGTTWQPEPEVEQEKVERKPKDKQVSNRLVRPPKALSASRHWMLFISVSLATMTFYFESYKKTKAAVCAEQYISLFHPKRRWVVFISYRQHIKYLKDVHSNAIFVR